MEVFGHNILIICLFKSQMLLTFAWWKGIPVPAPLCPTRDRDTHSIAVVRHPELIPKLCASMAEQHLSQKSDQLTELEFDNRDWCRPSRIFPHLTSQTNQPTQLSGISHLRMTKCKYLQLNQEILECGMRLLTCACSWNFIVPLPVSSSTNPIRTLRLSCGDKWVALWNIAVAGWAGPGVAPNPIRIVVWVPAEVVLTLSYTLCPLDTGNSVYRFSRPPPVVDTVCWFLLATNNIVNLPFLPDRQASAAVDFWWSWNEFFPFLAFTTTTTIWTPVAGPIFIMVITPERVPPRIELVMGLAIVELSLCGKSPHWWFLMFFYDQWNKTGGTLPVTLKQTHLPVL